MKAIRLKTNGLVNPLGIDSRHIFFSWNLEGGKKQTAYEIVVSNSVDDISMGKYLWCSQKVNSNSMIRNEYTGLSKSRLQLFWRVRVWDENDSVGEWSEIASFEFGFLEKSDWIAKWISGDYMPEKGKKYPADYFRKTINIKNKPIKARLYSTACGVYVNRINNAKVGENVLAPGRSTYEKRTFYQTYDVTDSLEIGDNTWEILLGDGWFRGKCGAFGASYVFGDITAYFGQLEVVYEDGTVETFISNEEFGWSNDGPVRMNDMKDFGIIDFNLKPSFKNKVRIIEYPTNLCSANNVPILEKEHFYPSILTTESGEKILDFGQNIAGYMQFSVKGEQGSKVRLQFGEMLDENGNFTNKNLVTLEKNEYIPDYCDDSHFQELEIILSGNRDVFKPELTIQGFRYVKLNNWPEEIIRNRFEAIAVYSDVDYCIDFSSSNSAIEKLVKNTEWSIKGNYLDVPTDCPTRERAAWLGDAQLFFDTSNYFIDGEAFYRKWMQDIYDDQAENGMVYNIVPRVAPHEGMNIAVEGSSGWVDAGILIPYRYFKLHKNKDFLMELYPHMENLMEYMISRMGDESNPNLDMFLPPNEMRKYIVTTGFHFGEWNEPDSGIESVMAPKYEVATAYLAYSLGCMAEMSEELGEKKKAERYSLLSEKVKSAYRYYFIEGKAHLPEKMCEFVRPVAFGLIEDKDVDGLSDGLLNLIKKSNYHVGTGFLSTPFLLPIVDSICGEEVAWKMLENSEYPSWLNEVSQGATTVWENWDGIASRNHYSNGAVCHWIFKNACGLSIEDENCFLISPKINGSTERMSLEWISKYGNVSCKWEKQNEKVSYAIKIPAGTTGRIIIEGLDEFQLDAGEYIFSVENKG